MSVVTRVHNRDGTELGLAVGFDAHGKADEFLDPFTVAQILDGGATIWILDKNDRIWGIPPRTVGELECLEMETRVATSATGGEGSTDRKDGSDATV